MTETLLLTRAYDFAARMHAGQTRKGAAAEPYINHPCEVAGLLAQANMGNDAILIAAGVLHDTIEDTAATQEDLSDLFGEEITRLVLEVSDDKSLPKAERKRLQILHAPVASPRAKMLKLADKISNLRSLTESPPADWSEARCREYVDWSKLVAAGCRGHDAWLEEAFDATALTALAALDGRSGHKGIGAP